MPLPVINSFTASTVSGGSTTLTWDVTGADSLTIDGATVTGTTTTEAVTASHEFTLAATNVSGTTKAWVTVSVAGEGTNPTRYFQIRELDRLGSGLRFQMFGGGNPQLGELAAYDGDRNVVGSGARGTLKGDWPLFTGSNWVILEAGASGDLPVADPTQIAGVRWDTPANILGNGGLDATVGDAWWGQIPRGVVDGSNTVFTTDYKLASKFTVLQVNTSVWVPTPDSDTSTDADNQYSITMDGVITMGTPPKAGDKLYINYFRNRHTTVPITSAILYVVSEHIPSAGSLAWGGGLSTSGVGFIFPHTDWIEDNSLWAKRTNSKNIDPTTLGDLFVLAMNYHDGSGIGPYSPPDEFRIYDSYVIVTYADTTTRTYRPTGTAVLPDPGAAGQGVLNPGFAIDGDPDTYATILATSYDSGLGGVFLNLNSYVLVP